MRNNTCQHVDITPTPRILRTLGDIPFEVWQCLAELIDNSLDAFLTASAHGVQIENPQIDITWSRSAPDAEIRIEDNGKGMKLRDLQNAARAGYSNNDSVHNLGLFGMGFNIATARLAEETVFLSTESGDESWVGIKINFDDLVNSGSFSAPVVKEPKDDIATSGTRVCLRRLKDGVLNELKSKIQIIRRRLEAIYSPVLSTRNTRINLQGNQLTARPHCVWSKTRCVMKRGRRIAAIQEIERDLGDAYFDENRNRYLTEDQSADLEMKMGKGAVLPPGVTKRARRLRGWLGIQRYSHVSNFGIDFVRNGRKILVADRSIFSFENPATGTPMLEYPVELGTTVGGRIVGEMHVDYLVPTYQKNAFDTTGLLWQRTIEAIRGAGPILPKNRKNFCYDGDNDSPLGLLISGYRRSDSGTKCLAVPRSVADQFAKEFERGNSEYQSDDKWFKAAQEADRVRSEGGEGATPVNTGETPSDDVDEYEIDGDGSEASSGGAETAANIAPPPQSSARDPLMQEAIKQESLSGKYAYGSTPPFCVTSWKVGNADILIDGQRVPCIAFSDGNEVDFFYDEKHSILAEYPITPKQLLLQWLAERFAIRDAGLSVQRAFMGLICNHLQEERVNESLLKERARAIMNEIRDALPARLAHRLEKTYEVLDAYPLDKEKLAETLLDESRDLLIAFQNRREDANQYLMYVPYSAICRFVEAMPEEFLDGKVFDSHYANINIGDDSASKRLQAMSLSKIITYLRDTCNLLEGKPSSKYELIRFSNTLSILGGLVTL